MNLSELLSDLDEAAARLRIARVYAVTAWKRMGEQEPTIPTPTGATPPLDAPDRFVSHDQQQRDRRLLERATQTVFREATAVYDVATRWGQPAAEPVEADAPDDMWCRSCWRDDKHHEPISVGRYKAWCRFCGDWRAANKRLPPVEILEARHRGQRITTQMVDRALASQRKKTKRKAS